MKPDALNDCIVKVGAVAVTASNHIPDTHNKKSREYQLKKLFDVIAALDRNSLDTFFSEYTKDMDVVSTQHYSAQQANPDDSGSAVFYKQNAGL